MIQYLPMDETHVAAVAKLEQLCFTAPWSENSIASEIDNPLSLWIVAMDGEHLVGYVGSQSVMGEADMMNLAVCPEYRRKGIGKKLVEELIIALKEKEVSCLLLEVRSENSAAIELYSKLGFIQVGRRPNYYTKPKDDALILRKEWDV